VEEEWEEASTTGVPHQEKLAKDKAEMGSNGSRFNAGQLR